jgi:hypothetical protein
MLILYRPSLLQIQIYFDILQCYEVSHWRPQYEYGEDAAFDVKYGSFQIMALGYMLLSNTVRIKIDQ